MVTEAFLKSFADAWNRHDVDDLMADMAEDGVFISSSGTRTEGSAEIRTAFASIFEMFPDASWTEDTHFVSGDRGVSEWTFSGTDADDGEVVKERGCDVFTFRDGKIVVKDTFLK
jgi:ketosteroid isomerase-like protein